MKTENDIVITHARRTAIGNFNGSLSTLPATELGKIIIKQLIMGSGVAPEIISEVIFGQVLQANCGQNPARQASIKAGLPQETTAYTINQVCGSGLRAVSLAAQSILTKQASIIIAGGQENMSLSPHTIHLRNGTKMGESKLNDSMITDGLWDCFNNYHMGITAENIANSFNISRKEQDNFAAQSQQKAEAAQNNNRFKEEITPITIKHRKGETIIDRDEFPKHGSTAEALSKLKPAFSKEGSVTAGNASGINDGAAALIITDRKTAEKYGLTPMAKIKSHAQAGVAPNIMGTGPIPASQKALELAGWTIDQLDLIEANEAFAAQAIAVNKALNWDTKKVNVNGGAIALGHPIGASGARILVTLLHEMKKQCAQKGLATLCIGGGMGIAMCVERET